MWNQHYGDDDIDGPERKTAEVMAMRIILLVLLVFMLASSGFAAHGYHVMRYAGIYGGDDVPFDVATDDSGAPKGGRRLKFGFGATGVTSWPSHLHY